MNNILRKIGLADSMKIELEIDKKEFVKILKANVDENKSDFMDVFSSSKNNYKGVVSYDRFEIKRKHRLFDMNMNFAKVLGNFRQKENKLLIDMDINAFQGKMMVMFIFMLVFYTIFIIVFSLAENIEGNAVGFAMPFIFVHALFMFGIPYFMSRRSVSRMKYEIERDLYFMVKQ
jgi:hypothetical protein